MIEGALGQDLGAIATKANPCDLTDQERLDRFAVGLGTFAGILGGLAVTKALNASRAAARGGLKGPFPPPSMGAAGRVPNVLQTGGRTVSKRAGKGLNEFTGESLTKREWGRALEGLKKDLGLPNNHHARILDNADYIDDGGTVLGNLMDYLP